ncbi:hypothetical protein [Microbacterium marinilacus]|uniref:DUF2975 domain-containing protein n=1 Tax=Microbacterium marinilacus TaxID=415209 RepID=A0ABP7BSC4_9MICO|nr:hypothetical protein [Microbacterium marinilacus]MBY0690398.1 hypothetical protein [Microbacterium marinilacus]
MSDTRRTSPELFPQGDRWTFLGMIPLAAVAAAWIVTEAVTALVRILPNRDAPVPFRLEDAATGIPLGGDGEVVTAVVERVVVQMNDLPPAALLPLAGSVVLHAVCMLAVLTCSAWFVLNLARGIAFHRTNTRLLAGVGVLVGVDLALTTLLDRIATTQAAAVLGGGAFEPAAEDLDFLRLFLVFGIGAVATAFGVGERLQRDTEGLV